MGIKRPSEFILTLEDNDIVSGSESDSEPDINVTNKNQKHKKRKMDEDLNSDFEFDGYGVLGGVKGIDDDGWGFTGIPGMKESAGVDLEGIIARRRENNNDDKADDNEATSDKVEGDEDEEDAESNEEGAEEDEEEDEDNEEFTGIEDDLAEDGFGMGADDDKEDEVNSDDLHEPENEEEHEEEDNEEDSENEKSDSDSVASPQPHPDDLASSDEEDHHTESPEETAQKAAYFAPAEDFTSTPTQSFDSMSLSRPILKALSAMNFHTPTQIQSRAIPLALQGKDIVGSAVTGSGKTAAFMIPVLERLSYRSRAIAKTRVLVLTPTRELAIQCFSVATKLAQFTDVTFCLAVGGLSNKSQEAELRKGPDVIIATPGRFIDHVRNAQGFHPDGLEILVIDEADRILDENFEDQLKEIVEGLPKSRQTMLFSATMTDKVSILIRLALTKPVRLFVDPKHSTVAGLTQEFIRIRPEKEHLRPAMLLELCQSTFMNRVIIFFRSKPFAHRMRIIFGLLNLKAAELHGNLTQEQRMTALEQFRKQEVNFLLATDVASRGLDIKGVDTVINYEAPASYEIYLHRVGRTARAGRSGRAITLAGEADRKIVRTALKAVKESGKIVSRVLTPENVDSLATQLDELEAKVEAVLKEEKEEKAMRIAEMEVRKGENVMKYQDEIMARPKRTWFATEREKAAAKGMSSEPSALIEEKGKAAFNGLPTSKKPKDKKSGADVEDGGRMYKKTKAERGVKHLQKQKSGKAKKSAVVGKRKGKPRGKR